MDTFCFWFHVAWGSCAFVWVVSLGVFSWEMRHAPELPDDGHGT